MIKFSEFNKNVAKVLSGTFFAQALPFALAAILARIYSVEEYGDYYSFAAIVSILGAVSSGKYELAILNPKSTKEAIALCQGAILISFTVNTFVLLILLLFSSDIARLINMESIAHLLWVAPIAAFSLSCSLSLSFLLNRKKAFGKLTKGKIILSLFTNFSRLGLGLAKLGTLGLMVSLIFGYISQAVFFLKHLKINDLSIITNKGKRKQLFSDYSNFPKAMVPATLLNKSSNDLPPILIKSLFSGKVAGWYGQMTGLLKKPLAILGKAFEEVYRQKASEEIHEMGHCRPIFYSTLKKLSLFGIIPFTILFFAAPWAFSIFLGEKWLESGIYAQYFAIPLFLQFVSSPLSSTFYLMSKNTLVSILEFVQLTLIIVAFSYAHFIHADAIFLIISLSIAYSIAYLCKIIALVVVLKRPI
jgi:O-antigen/teichoic acid export membrane protein